MPTITRTVNDNNGHVSVWTYVNSGFTSTNPLHTVTVTDPLLNVTTYTFYGEYVTKKVVNQGSSTVLETDVVCYNGLFANCPNGSGVPPYTQIDTFTYPNGSSKASDVQTTFNSSNETVSSVTHFDFGAATVLSPTAAPLSTTKLSSTQTLYGTYNGSGCSALGNPLITDQPCEVTTSGPTGTIVEQTTYVRNSAGHATQTSTLTGGSSHLVTNASYNANGTTNTSTDANGALTTYGYDRLPDF